MKHEISRRTLLATGLGAATLLAVPALSFGKQKSVRLTAAHALADSHPGSIQLINFAKAVTQETDNSLHVNAVVGGALGTEEDEINQTVTGAIDFSLIAGITIFQGLDGRLQVEDVPFLFDTHEAAYKAVDGKFGDAISGILADKGLKVLAYWENGFRNFTNNKREIKAPNDMKGLKFRSALSKLRIAMFKELGSSAIPIAFTELFTALQQGTVDGQENPLSIIYTSKFNEVQKYLSLSGHIWNADVLVVNPARWDSFDEDQKKVVLEQAIKYRDIERKQIQDQDDQLVETLKKSGMVVSEVDKEAFRNAVGGVRGIYEKEYGDELLKLI